MDRLKVKVWKKYTIQTVIIVIPKWLYQYQSGLQEKKILPEIGKFHNPKRVISWRSYNSKYVCSNNRASQCIKKQLTELKGPIDRSITILGTFNNSLSTVKRTRRQRAAML